jgi:transforming growth factor-beta-induced protein
LPLASTESVPIYRDSIKANSEIHASPQLPPLWCATPVTALYSAANLSVNGAMVVKGDTPVSRGNIMFIGEVLFVSESVVSKLHQQHRDKETPPLLAFPWFGAQFLSHAFLALERDKRFTHITRFLNLADLAPHVSGTGYTFFVPTDTAFEELGLDKMPDNYLSTGDGLQILLNHFVKGRLYDKDLKDGIELTTLGNKTIGIKRTKG